MSCEQRQKIKYRHGHHHLPKYRKQKLSDDYATHKAPESASSVRQDEERSERVAKRLARAGIASRREAETMIALGRVTVNGHILGTAATNVKKTDAITVDGKPLPQIECTRLWLYHKPIGLITTMRDPERRPTVFENLPGNMPRVLSVGRLDINTEGLLLLTNDGGLARVLELPSTGWVRHYRVRAHGKISLGDLDALKNGIVVNGIFYSAMQASIERVQGSNVWLSIILRIRLIRIAFGPFQLGTLGKGMVCEIRRKRLRDQLGEQLVSEANANFDAPILKPYSNRSGMAFFCDSRKSARGGPQREQAWISSNRDRRQHAVPGYSPAPDRHAAGLMTTRPCEKRKERCRRNANVWMASGARPRHNHFRIDDGALRVSKEKKPQRVKPSLSGKKI